MEKHYKVTFTAIASHQIHVEMNFTGDEDLVNTFSSAYSAVCWFMPDFTNRMNIAYGPDWELLDIRVREAE